MGTRLAGRVAIVTGAGRGIGRGEALLLAQEGAAVVVNDLGVSITGEGASSSPADAVVAAIKEAGGKAIASYDDVTSMQGGESMVKLALDTFGRLDILVNNAGILRDRMVFNMSEAEWDAVIAVHLKGHFTVTRASSVIFRQQRSGRIVNTSSGSGLGLTGQANYSAAKEGIIGFTRTVARDLGRYGVTCNAIRPAAGTRMSLRPEVQQAAEQARPGSVDRTAVASFADLAPEAVAPLVVYLATDAASYINGRDFAVRGRAVGLYTIPSIEQQIWARGDRFTVDELADVMPRTLGLGLRNEFAPESVSAGTLPVS